MESTDWLLPAARDRRLAWSLRAVAVGELAGLLLLGAHWLRQGWSAGATIAGVLLVWALVRLTVPIGSFGFKLALRDWPAARRGPLIQALRTLALESWWMVRLYLVDQPWRS